jgi:hypothetical protein
VVLAFVAAFVAGIFIRIFADAPAVGWGMAVLVLLLFLLFVGNSLAEGRKYSKASEPTSRLAPTCLGGAYGALLGAGILFLIALIQVASR